VIIPNETKSLDTIVVESTASCGKIRDFPTACLGNSFGVTHTSHNPATKIFHFQKTKGLTIETKSG
jgi:hypothetical protein